MVEIKSMKSKEIFLPFMDGRYRVEAGLIPLAKDRLKKIFDFDEEFSFYRGRKQVSRNNLGETYPKDLLSQEKKCFVQRWMINRLLKEWPTFFQSFQKKNELHLNCALTNEILRFSSDFKFINDGGYEDGIDALAQQLQEDLAVWEINGRENRMALCHLSFPNGWDVRSKMGKNFIQTHTPVADFENLEAKEKNLVETMVFKGPYARFAWGLQAHSQLRKDPGERAIQFQDELENLYLRVERQTLSPLSEIKCSFFTIRTYLYPLRSFKKDGQIRKSLLKAVESMSKDALRYKNILN
jgi:hypothetical protein